MDACRSWISTCTQHFHQIKNECPSFYGVVTSGEGKKNGRLEGIQSNQAETGRIACIKGEEICLYMAKVEIGATLGKFTSWETTFYRLIIKLSTRKSIRVLDTNKKH